MKKLAYMCVNCKKRVKEDEDTVGYVVMDIDESYEPTCSIKCAEVIKQRNIERAKRLLEKVKKAEIEKLDF